MFFPEAMTEVELIVPSKDLLAVTKVLGNRGVFHQIDSTYLGLENLGPNTWQEKAAGYSTLERRIQVIMQNLNLVEEYSGASNFDTIADLEPLRAAVDRIEGEVKQTSDQLAAEKKTLEQLESQLSQLEPIADTNVNVGALRKSNYLHSVLGIIPAENVSRLETSLSRVPHTFLILREDPKRPVVWVLGPRSSSDVIDRAVKSAYLNPLTLPEEFEGTPAEISASIRRAIETSNQKISELNGILEKLANTHKQELHKLLWDVHVSRMIADAIARFGQLRHTYVVVGWVPSADLDALTQRLKQASREILIEATPAAPERHRSNVPVALRNPGILSPFELLVNTYARPRYEEIDPTILIAITFPLLYGAMFGDVGHGLVLAAIGWFLSRRSTLGGLLVACGLSGMIFGFIYGSVFGFEDVLPHLIQPSENILQILSMAIGAGIVLINIAILLNLYNAFRARDWGRFFFDSNGLAGWILYLSFLVILGNLASKLFTGESFLPGILLTIGRIDIVVTIAKILFVIGMCLAVIFSHPLQHWMHDGHFVVEGGWGIFAVQSAAEILEKIISMLSNTLSYVRVGAFAIVHAGFTGAVFIIAKLVSGGQEAGFGYWTVVVLGNLFVIGLEGFIVTIQTMRLHYYEFFSKFFQGGGSPYEPLALASVQEK
ncbi:MAG TPA: V-type ATPase 116kDa subunit family protein [Anaerolineales bacterium]|nr:V-type ATPase 116kDa subunit family protein [Anaerolineales bacterium]